MTVVDTLAHTAAKLPPEKQREVLDFAEFLAQRRNQNGALRDVHGIWNGVNIGENDITEMRREAWNKYSGDAP